jgi:hypothetical protein
MILVDILGVHIVVRAMMLSVVEIVLVPTQLQAIVQVSIVVRVGILPLLASIVLIVHIVLVAIVVRAMILVNILGVHIVARAMMLSVVEIVLVPTQLQATVQVSIVVRAIMVGKLPLLAPFVLMEHIVQAIRAIMMSLVPISTH